MEKEAEPTGRGDNLRFEKLFSLSEMQRTWRQVRKELRQLDMRDVIDFYDWSELVEKTLPVIRETILDGSYQPLPPSRYELCKGKGSYRVMTSPNVRDSLVYRHISNAALKIAGDQAIEGVFFSRRHSATPTGKGVKEDAYESFFEIWLRYKEYQTRTLLSDPHHVLVTTDITNYFDSIEHDLLLEYLAPLGLPRKAVGLLGRLLEMLKPTAGHSPNPRVGLPVDELDCSRQLAHLFLFEHDREIVDGLKPTGQGRYARWMDDQNVGVASLTEARQVVNLLTRSLQKQRLTLNAGKTKFLTPSQVVEEFHLDGNKALSTWEAKWKRKRFKPTAQAQSELLGVWIDAMEHQGKGHWDKLLKRFYAATVHCDLAELEDAALENVVAYPAVAPRIFQSLAKKGKVEEMLALFDAYVTSGESLFEATEAQFFEALVMAEVPLEKEAAVLDLVRRYLRGDLPSAPGGAMSKASAMIAHHWFGGKPDDVIPHLESLGWTKIGSSTIRALLASVFAVDPKAFQSLGIKLVGHPSDDVARLTEYLQALVVGAMDKPKSNYANLRPRWPKSGKNYDVRSWILFEVLSHTATKGARSWVRGEVKRFKSYAATVQEQRVLKRVQDRIKT